MTKFHLRKVSANLLAVEPDGLEFVEGLKAGEVIGCEGKRARNYQFLKKYMAMLTLAYDYWEPGEGDYKGQAIEKNFDRFRKDVQILAGYGEPVWNIRGELRMESKSISFGRMHQETFDKLYNAVLTVLLRMVLGAKGFTAQAVNDLVDQLADFG